MLTKIFNKHKLIFFLEIGLVIFILFLIYFELIILYNGFKTSHTVSVSSKKQNTITINEEDLSKIYQRLNISQ